MWCKELGSQEDDHHMYWILAQWLSCYFLSFCSIFFNIFCLGTLVAQYCFVFLSEHCSCILEVYDKSWQRSRIQTKKVVCAVLRGLLYCKFVFVRSGPSSSAPKKIIYVANGQFIFTDFWMLTEFKARDYLSVHH